MHYILISVPPSTPSSSSLPPPQPDPSSFGLLLENEQASKDVLESFMSAW